MRGRLGLGLALVSVLAGCAREAKSPVTLRVALPSELQSLDPHVSDTAGAFTVLGNVYEALVTTDPGLGRRPNLALRWHNPDPLTWDFELDPAARFHSGKPLTAADVVFSFRRAIAQPGLDIRYYLGDVERVAARGPHALRLELKRPTPALLSKLGHVYVVPAGSTQESLERAPEGTGPYRVTGWRAGSEIELEAVPGGRHATPAVARIKLQVNVAPDLAVRGLLDGEHDLALLGLTRLARSLPEGEFSLQRRESMQVKYLGFDVERAVTPQVQGRNPFRDRRVRQAIHLAIDRQALVAGLPNDASPANQLVPRHVFGFDTSLPEVVPDRVQARALLRQAGYPEGFAVSLHTREILKEAALPLVDQLATVGIRARVVVLPDPRYFDLLDRRETSLWLDRWSCTTGESGEMFENAFHSPDPARGLGGFNESGFSDPAMDRAIETALALEDLQRRRVALADLMARIMHEAIWVPLYTDDEVWAVRRSFVWRPRSDFWLRLAEVAPSPAGR